MKLMIDSGALARFNGTVEEINLGKYISFLQNHRHLIDRYVSLDVIPGESGIRDTDPARIERDAHQSYANHQRMLDAGLLTPWPVFHRNDRFSWLERYLDGEQRLCLAALPFDRAAIIEWLDECFTLIPPTVAVHLLGITTVSILRRYPLVSADSKSWVGHAMNGKILVPLYDRGIPDYSYEPDVIAVTGKSDLKDMHIDLIDGFRRQQAERFIEEEVGMPWSQLRCDDKAGRMRVNAKVYEGIAKKTGVTVFLVTNLHDEQHLALSQSRAWTRLLLFAELQNKRDGALQKYCSCYGE